MSDTEMEDQDLSLTDENVQPEMRPIFINYKKQKKKHFDRQAEKKAKYTTGLKDIQLLEADVMRVAQKATSALSKSINTYEEERQKSARAKTDGAVEDFFYNSAKAASKYFKEASDLPLDLMASVNRTSYRKRMRKNLRRASRAMRMWRL